MGNTNKKDVSKASQERKRMLSWTDFKLRKSILTRHPHKEHLLQSSLDKVHFRQLAAPLSFAGQRSYYMTFTDIDSVRKGSGAWIQFKWTCVGRRTLALALINLPSVVHTLRHVLIKKWLPRFFHSQCCFSGSCTHTYHRKLWREMTHIYNTLPF